MCVHLLKPQQNYLTRQLELAQNHDSICQTQTGCTHEIEHQSQQGLFDGHEGLKNTAK